MRPPLEGFVGFDDVIEAPEKYGFLPETLAADAYASVGSPPQTLTSSFGGTMVV